MLVELPLTTALLKMQSTGVLSQGLSGTQRVICPMALAGQQSFPALNAAYRRDHLWSGHTHTTGCKTVKLPVRFAK